ncbi:hypothetical protein AUP41_17250 [Thalassospira xiamenensis]|jgi:hypothetical protein|nr:hypothetical protein AUP41_17250 [Thalassospira xiamenensis]
MRRILCDLSETKRNPCFPGYLLVGDQSAFTRIAVTGANTIKNSFEINGPPGAIWLCRELTADQQAIFAKYRLTISVE